MYGAKPRYNDRRYNDILGLNDGNVIVRAQNIPSCNDKVNITDHRNANTV